MNSFSLENVCLVRSTETAYPLVSFYISRFFSSVRVRKHRDDEFTKANTRRDIEIRFSIAKRREESIGTDATRTRTRTRTFPFSNFLRVTRKSCEPIRCLESSSVPRKTRPTERARTSSNELERLDERAPPPLLRTRDDADDAPCDPFRTFFDFSFVLFPRVARNR